MPEKNILELIDDHYLHVKFKNKSHKFSYFLYFKKWKALSLKINHRKQLCWVKVQIRFSLKRPKTKLSTIFHATSGSRSKQ